MTFEIECPCGTSTTPPGDLCWYTCGCGQEYVWDCDRKFVPTGPPPQPPAPTLPALDPARFAEQIRESAKRRLVDAVVEMVLTLLSIQQDQAAEREKGPSAVASAPSRRPTLSMYCQSQYDDE